MVRNKCKDRNEQNYTNIFSDPIQVGYDPTVYTTSESEGMVELNIFVFSHPVDGTPRPFALFVGQSDGTSGMYVLRTHKLLTWTQGLLSKLVIYVT